MRNVFLYSTVSLIALAGAAAAETGAETIVVSATRTPEKLEVTGTSLSVITAEELETRQSVVLSDVLAEVPGVTVVRNGGVGQVTSVLMRGAEVGQSLILVDGMRINDPSATTGQALMGDVLANGLSRVEVLRGPQSTLYGSDAIGGVVNLITQRGGDNKLTLTAEGGSLDTAHLNAAASGTLAGLEFGAATNFLVTNSVSAADAAKGNKEADGYHNFGATGSARWHATDEVSLDARLYYTKSRTSFDGYPPPAYSFADDHEYGDNSLLALYGGVNADLLGGRFTNRASFSYSDADRTTYDTVKNFWAKGASTSAEYQGGFKLNDASELVFGYEHLRTGLGTQSQYDATATRGSVRTNAVYGQIQTAPLEGLTITLGGRFTDNSEFGDHTSFKANVAYQATETTTLRANFGDGFKAPSLYQLYSQYSNPVTALKPELATGFEVGLDQKIAGFTASLTYFQRHTANQIDFYSCWGVSSTACTKRPSGYYYNIARSLARGLEVEAEGKLSEQLTLNLSYTNLTNFNQITRLQLARRPHDTASATLTWQALDDLTLGTTIIYTGERFDNASHTVKLHDRADMKLFGAYQLGHGLELFARMENAGDDRDQTVGGYGTMGRTVYGGIRAKL